MLPSQFRTTLSFFRRNPNKAVHYHSSFFAAGVKESQSTIPRCVVFVPKALDKRSVLRHKTKRIVTELLRLPVARLQTGLDISIKMKKLITDENKQNAQKELTEIIKRISAR